MKGRWQRRSWRPRTSVIAATIARATPHLTWVWVVLKTGKKNANTEIRGKLHVNDDSVTSSCLSHDI